MDAFVEVEAFVSTHLPRLRRAAWLRTGDWHLADDLVQTALAKCLPRWNDVADERARQAYVVRVMTTTYLAWRKRRWNGEISFATPPDADTEKATVDGELRIVLMSAIDRLPAKQRAAVILRYFVDLSESDIAASLGCSSGTVKTHLARGLRTLRQDPRLEETLLEG